jgi:hypothetical protein
MGASGKTWLTCRMEEQHYSELELHKHPEIQILSIEPEFDYSRDQQHELLKMQANSLYKKLKERELILRTKTK